MDTTSRRATANLRLSAHHIAQADMDRPEDVVRHLLAMQAQDYNGALWSIGLRTRGCTRKDVEQAIIDRKIVRTWPMRGTLHFMHTDDAAWMVKLLAGRATAKAKGRRLGLGLTDAVIDDAEQILRRELAGSKIVRRDELKTLLSTRLAHIKFGSEQFGHILRYFGEQGVLCFGPHDGKQPTFVLMADWLPTRPEKSRDDALRELATRYFVSHGPATIKDFTGWTGLTLSDSRLALGMALPELEAIVVSDTTYYQRPVLEPAKGSGVYILPGFDEFMLGYKDRSAALSPEYSDKIVPGNNGMFLPTIIAGGQVIGAWKGTATKKAADIIPSYFGSGAMADDLLATAIGRYQHFLALS